MEDMIFGPDSKAALTVAEPITSSRHPQCIHILCLLPQLSYNPHLMGNWVQIL